MNNLFHLSPEERAFVRTRKVFALVIYDIVSNKRRLKLSQLLESYGVRVQKSCFELLLDTGRFKSLLLDLEEFYKADEGDNIIVYKGKKSDIVTYNSYQGAEEIRDVLFL